MCMYLHSIQALLGYYSLVEAARIVCFDSPFYHHKHKCICKRPGRFLVCQEQRLCFLRYLDGKIINCFSLGYLLFLEQKTLLAYFFGFWI